MLNPKLYLVVLLLAYCSQIRANTLKSVVDDFQQAISEGKTTTILGVDNDTLLLNRNDGFYTSGIHFDRQYVIRGSDQSSLFAWRFGQELYTSADIKRSPELIGPPDHPCAAWLYAGIYKETYFAGGAQTRIGLDIGCLGPCAGGLWAQTNLHRILHQPLPQGWAKQVKNELGAVLYGEITTCRWNVSQSLDLTPHLRGRFGNIFADVGGGFTLRAGRLADLPNQTSLFGVMRFDTNVVAYNATLQGGYFSSGNVHTVEPKRIVNQAQLGIVWRDGKYGVNASIVRRGNEIRPLSNAIGAQNFARLEFSYTP